MCSVDNSVFFGFGFLFQLVKEFCVIEDVEINGDFVEKEDGLWMNKIYCKLYMVFFIIRDGVYVLIGVDIEYVNQFVFVVWVGIVVNRVQQFIDINVCFDYRIKYLFQIEIGYIFKIFFEWVYVVDGDGVVWGKMFVSKKMEQCCFVSVVSFNEKGVRVRRQVNRDVLDFSRVVWECV